MSHISFHTPSLPAAHYLFAHVFGATKTRHALERARGEEWVDFISRDMMGSDQVSIHLDPAVRASEPAYTIAQIADGDLGSRELLRHLTGPSAGGAVIGNIAAPMPHWGPVFSAVDFDRVLTTLQSLGFDDRVIAPQNHHPGQEAEHRTLFLTLGRFSFELKGYSHAAAISAELPAR